MHFHINVVRGPTFHVGAITGIAKLGGDTATWTDAPNPDGETAAVLRLKFNANRHLTVESENAEAYHGARAHFDGDYFKVFPLKKE